MADSITITAQPSDNPGLDYALLKERGVQLIQELSGNIWTDYNEHDPGVTTLEQLCYALTELSYRASFPLEDLLIDPKLRRIDTQNQALFTASASLTCNPVTVNDYRKLLVDRVPGIANVWLTPAPGPVNGLYDIAVYAPGADPCACDDTYSSAAILQRVRAVYCAHRDLCEDMQNVCVLDPVVTVVKATVSIDSTRAAETILAAILFNIGNLFAPVLSRKPLASLIDEGLTAAEIFDGPLLLNGFIADAALQPSPDCITLSMVTRAIARTPGVSGLRGVIVTVGANPPAPPGPILVPSGSILALDTLPGPKGYAITLLRNGIEIRPNSDRVQSELARLKAEQARTYPLAAQYEQYFGVPQGRVVDLKSYYSIQNQYPAVYGVNQYGVPDEASPARRGQAKQLKGYLLPFEQLLADFFAQLAHARALFSITPDLGQTYFSQYLDANVPNVLPLLRAIYKPGLDAIVMASDPRLERRNKFLDVLLALYGERLDAGMLVTASGQQESDADTLTRLLRAKLALLHALLSATGRRGCGIDYLAAQTPHNIAGMLIKSRIQLGIDPFPPSRKSDLLAELSLNVVETEGESSIGRTIAGGDDTIEANFAPVPPPEDDTGASFGAPSVLHGQRVTEDFLSAAATLENFRFGPLPGGGGVALVCKAGDSGRWHFVSRYPDEAQARAAAAQLAQTAQTLTRAGRQLQVIEHILLRDFLPPEDTSFIATAVSISSWREARDADFQASVRAIVQANAPAAVQMRYCFLGPLEGRIFEGLYWLWLEALNGGAASAAAAAGLGQFLTGHRTTNPD